MVVLALAAATAVGCKAKTPVINEPFADAFDRAELGAGWLDTSGGQFRVRDGKLNVQGGLNRPLWLRKRLPRDLVVELDVMSRSDVGDIKIELFGDGESFDPDQGTYFPTGYVFVFGGWGTACSIIGKLGEHDDGVKASRPHVRPAARPGTDAAGRRRRYSGRAAAADRHLDEAVVPGAPTAGSSPARAARSTGKSTASRSCPGRIPLHFTETTRRYLGFNNWQSDVYFDNLTIRPAP